jgi:tetratricopeptide (TPR) repeat protein
MSRLHGRSQNRESQETCPAGAGAAFQRKHFGAAKARPRLIGLLLALVTLLVYLPVCRHGFVVYDDNDYVTENHVVQNGLTWAGVKWAFTTWHASNWHPVTWLSHMLDCELFGLNPGAQHLGNVLFHAANVVLLFALLLRLTNALWPSAFVAALFAWHPLHVESVAWISERKDVLSTFFGLMALLAYARYAQRVTGDKWQVTRTGEQNVSRVTCHVSLYFWLALIFFALGLMSKPMLVTLPFVMLLLDYWPLRRISEFARLRYASTRPEIRLAAPEPTAEAGVRSSESNKIASPSTLNPQLATLVLEKWPFFLLAAASCVMTFLAQSQRGGDAVISLQKVSLSYRLCNALMSSGRYLLKTIWPTDLAVFYPLSDQVVRVRVLAIVAALVLAVVSWFVWRKRRSCPYLLVGWLWYLGTLVPVIGLVQVGGAALADRYTYIPSIGPFIAAAFGLQDLAGRFRFLKMPFAVVAGLMLAGCLMLTENQLRYWRNSQTLFAHAVAVTENNDVAHTNLGVALEQQGKLDEALAEYREAERLAPERYEVHNNLGNLLAGMGKPREALAEYQEAVRLDPDLPFLRDSLGSVLAELGRFSEAMNEFTNAARLDPTYPWPHFEIGKALLKQGRDAGAIDQFREALRLGPDNFQILAFTAHVLAADENPQIRDGKTALVLAAKANALTGGAQPFVLDALGMACAETGDFTNALDVTQKALDLASAAKVKNLEGIQQRLQLYQNHQPWRESFRLTNAPVKQ